MGGTLGLFHLCLPWHNAILFIYRQSSFNYPDQLTVTLPRLFLSKQTNDKRKKKKQQRTHLVAVGKFRNSLDKRLADARGVIDPSQVEQKQNHPKNNREIDPRRYLLLAQFERGGVLAHRPHPQRPLAVMINMGGRALCVKGSAGGWPKLPEGAETGRKWRIVEGGFEGGGGPSMKVGPLISVTGAVR